MSFQEERGLRNMQDLQYTPNFSIDFTESRDSVISENDVSQYLKSLRARLGFARFKMNQGWENSTIFDVEQLWRQKQQNMMNNLPRPRFTQQDIIDKRVYVPKSKKSKLCRTYSSPSQFPVEHDSICKKRKHNSPKKHQKLGSPPKLQNSLDCLSYAIAMTEEANLISSQPLPDITRIEPNIENEDLTTMSIPNRSPSPSSPITSAAKTIMMLVNNPNSQSSNGYGKKPLYSQ